MFEHMPNIYFVIHGWLIVGNNNEPRKEKLPTCIAVQVPDRPWDAVMIWYILGLIFHRPDGSSSFRALQANFLDLRV